MPTHGELKEKWFIPMDGSSPDGVPARRHTEDAGPNSLSVSTDGNTVTTLIDGSAYMQRWHDELLALHGATSAELYHAAWRLEGVKTLGNTVPGNDALDDINDADSAGVSVYPLVCRNLMTIIYNAPTVLWLRLHLISNACLDPRFPVKGSNHHKFAVFKSSTTALALLGSIDISKTRWDTPAHLPVNADRDGQSTHDTAVAVQGPAIVDVEKTYRERWNDSSRGSLLPTTPPPIASPLAAPAGGGTHSVQVLRTYGITKTRWGYSWSPRGEFTVWASYLNAINKATSYIYIEDQYFLPFDWPPCHKRTGLAQETDIIFQLGEAMKRGVRVAVVTPSNDEDWTHVYQKYQRDVGVNYLLSVKAAGATGDVVVASLRSGGADVYVHSKLMIVDDEFVLIGSANVGQRAMSYDGELHIGVVDSANTFAKQFRVTVWREHTGRSTAALDNPIAAYGHFKTDTAASSGHLMPYPFDPLAVYPAVAGSTAPPVGHPTVMRDLVDLYAGPPGIR